MRLDLHVHSTASDGSCDPEEVVRRAVQGHLDVIALSDHDTLAGVEAAIAAASDAPIEVIPALEMSSTRDGRELHVLGYFVDTGNPALIRHEERARGRRVKRIREMLVRLAEQGIEIPEETVFRLADEASIGRPHLARAMVEHGVVASHEEAFSKWIGDQHPAFVATAIHDPVEAIQLIREAGGIAVWAHPPRELADPLTREFAEAGLGGLEVYRPYHSPGYTQTLESLCMRHDLVRTGGSDWHGPHHGDLGNFFVEDREIGDFLEKGGF